MFCVFVLFSYFINLLLTFAQIEWLAWFALFACFINFIDICAIWTICVFYQTQYLRNFSDLHVLSIFLTFAQFDWFACFACYWDHFSMILNYCALAYDYILVSMRFIQDDATNHRSSHATNDNNETNSPSVDFCTLRRKERITDTPSK